MLAMTSLVVTGTLWSVKLKILNNRPFKESVPSIDLEFDGWLRSAWCFLCHACPLANPKGRVKVQISKRSKGSRVKVLDQEIQM